MALPWDALITPLTKDAVEGTIYDLLAALGVSTTSWSKKGTARTIIGVTSTVIAGITSLVAVPVKGMVLETSEGVWLTILAKYVYGVDRVEATFAESTVDLVNAGGGVYAYDVGEVVFLNSTTGKTYTNSEAFSLGALETRNDLPVRAVEAGSASNATSGQIDDFVTPLLQVSVSNPAAAVGQDEQSDADLRQDCADARGALSPLGAKGAYAFFAKRDAKKAPLVRADGTAIGVNRVQVVVANLGGAVDVYVATASGDVSGSASTPGDDLYIVNESIQSLAVPYGITATVQNCNAIDWTVLYTVYADAASGLTAAALKTKINNALTDYYATYPIGGVTVNGTTFWAFLAKLRSIIEAADPAILNVVLSTPLADQELEPGDRLNLIIAVGCSVNMVSQP